jgi:hypothetical protein
VKGLSQVELETELFPLEPTLERLIGKLRVWEYRAESTSDTINSFGGLDRLAYHAAKALGIQSFSSDHGAVLVSTQPIGGTASSQLGGNIQLASVSENRELSPRSDYRLILRLLYPDLRTSIETSGFSVRGSVAYDPKLDIGKGLQSSHPVISQIAERVAIHPGFYYKVRWVEDKLALQITPKSVLEFTADLNGLIQETSIPVESLEDLFDRVRLVDGRVATLRSILELTADQPIREEPYDGKTYLEHTKTIYPGRAIGDPKGRLLVVLCREEDSCEYATSEGSVPIIDIQSLSHFDRNYYSAVTSRFKSESSRRRDSAVKYSKQLKLTAFGTSLTLRPRASYIGSQDGRRPSQGNLTFGRFNTLARQSVSFRNKSGEIVSVSRSTGHTGAPQDLMAHRDLLPFSIPKEIRAAMLYSDGLKSQAELLRNSLLGTPSSYSRGFQSFFGGTLNIREPVPLGTEMSSLSDSDCVLIVGPRSQPSFSFSKRAYTDAEVSVLEHGIPAQYVTTGGSSGTSYDMPMTKKVNNQYFLFGLGASILAKIGGNSMVLSDETTREFPENSVVIAYNIARVFESVPAALKSSSSAAYLTRTSVPISAAVAIMDQAGAEVIHQSPHVIPNETALFKGERGRIIFDGVPDGTRFVVIHKDGTFYSEELEDLKKLGGTQLKIIPVSINTVSIPRLTSTLYQQRYLPLPGQVIPLSKNEFLLCTTQVDNPQTRGWPNPLLVRIHEILSEPLSSELKWRVVYQLWALTRSHPASLIPTRRPLSIHYANKMGQFIRKAQDPQPGYFGRFTGTKNRFGYHPRPFI